MTKSSSELLAFQLSLEALARNCSLINGSAETGLDQCPEHCSRDTAPPHEGEPGCPFSFAGLRFNTSFDPLQERRQPGGDEDFVLFENSVSLAAPVFFS